MGEVAVDRGWNASAYAAASPWTRIVKHPMDLLDSSEVHTTLQSESYAERYAHTLAGHTPDKWESLADHLDKVADSTASSPWCKCLNLRGADGMS